MTGSPRRIARAGLTVVECLFAMSIMLIGLVGIAAIVPFAGRQAADSYTIVQALSAGENAIAVFNSNAVSVPTISAPWQMLEDAYPVNPSSTTGLPNPLGDSRASSFESFPKLYEGDASIGRFYSLYKLYFDLSAGVYPNNPVGQQLRAAVAQNRALGSGFCVDPMFMAQQLAVPIGNTKLMERDWGNFRRSRFPFYHETYPASMNPFDPVSASNPTTPRLIRVSFHDPNIPLGTNSKASLRLPAALRLATASGGDVAKSVPDEDRSSAPLRDFLTSTSPLNFGAVVTSTSSPSMQSWIATITPAETTPIVDPSTLPLGPFDYDTTTPIPLPPSMRYYPESYDLSVVVFGKRNATELVIDNYSAFAANGVIPDGERLFAVNGFGPEHRSSSTFDVEISATNPDIELNPKFGSVRVGDWLMMSRFVFANPVAQTGPIREHHKWYRVINVAGDDLLPRQIRVSGQPWDWTLPEIEAFKSGGATSTAALPNVPAASTVVTLVPHVINVYQRTLRVSN